MKIRTCFVSNSSTSSYIRDEDAISTAFSISETLNGVDWKNLSEKDKKAFIQKWTDIIKDIECTEGSN